MINWKEKFDTTYGPGVCIWLESQNGLIGRFGTPFPRLRRIRDVPDWKKGKIIYTEKLSGVGHGQYQLKDILRKATATEIESGVMDTQTVSLQSNYRTFK